jgi:hemoglobin/transferrin/lactoferrin receptor protein
MDPAKLSLGLKYETSDWDLRVDIIHRQEKTSSDLDSVFIPKSTTQYQFVVPAATTLDLSGQWRVRKDLRLNFAINNLTDRKYWNWSDVQGLSANATPLVVDAYTQPGRHINLSLVADF